MSALEKKYNALRAAAIRMTGLDSDDYEKLKELHDATYMIAGIHVLSQGGRMSEDAEAALNLLSVLRDTHPDAPR